MNLTFYKNTSDPRKAVKTLTSLGQIQNCILRDEQPVIDPVFEVASAALPDDFNYCYCDYTGRYYFTGDPIMVRSGLWRIPCHVDVLSTYYTDLAAKQATITRNEFIKNGYMLDDKYKSKVYTEFVTHQFPNAMDDDCLILITVS